MTELRLCDVINYIFCEQHCYCFSKRGREGGGGGYIHIIHHIKLRKEKKS